MHKFIRSLLKQITDVGDCGEPVWFVHIAVLYPMLSLKSWVRNIYLLVTWWCQFVVYMCKR